METGDVLMFFHQYLNVIAHKIYIKEEAKEVQVHLYLADYFCNKADPTGNKQWKSDNRRAFSELLYHELRGKRWRKVDELLTDIRFIEARCQLGMTFELVSEYLAALEAVHKPNLLGVSWDGYSFSSVHAVEDFLRYVQGQGHVLARFPNVVFQQVSYRDICSKRCRLQINQTLLCQLYCRRRCWKVDL
jgi:telomerase protein component 1